MATVVRMPAALAGVTEGAVQSWLAQPGQRISAGEPLAEIETEKAVVEFAAETDGTVARLLAEPGRTLAVGDPIAVIMSDGEDDAAVDAALAAAGAEPTTATDGAESPAEFDAAPAPNGAPVEAPAGSAPTQRRRLFATPLVRRLAKERGIDLTTVRGTGPNGRIVRRDIEALPAGPDSMPSEPMPSESMPTAAADATAATYTDVPLSRMRRAIARRLTESFSTVPQFYVTAYCRVDRLLQLRAEVNEVAEHKVSVNDFVLKAVAAAHGEVPAANRIWNGDSIRQFEGVDVGVAVALEDGLITPVVRRVDRLGVADLNRQVADLADRARAGRLQQHELEGGSFTVSNLGMYGVDEFSAIINPPQSGILAVGAAKQQAVVDGGAVSVATIMAVTLSVDHRVIDGAVAAQWMAAFVRLVENPLRLLI